MNRKYFERTAGHIKKSPYEIFVDQAGYMPDDEKIAVLPFSCESFEVKNVNGETVFSGKTDYFGPDKSSGDEIWKADLSDLKDSGRFTVSAGGKSSAEFAVGEGVYDNVLHDTAKAFYYLRCGCGLDKRYAGLYSHGPCHNAKAVLWEDRSVFRDVRGGWHDAGDYGRYVTAGACAAAHLLYAFKLFSSAFINRTLDIPEEDMPDILSEIRCELEWLMKMQREDGGVFHKVTTMVHAPFVMPEDDKEQLFIFPISSMAAADLAAVCALASGIYRPYDASFSQRLLSAAKLSAEWLEKHSEFIGFENPRGCNTGGYGQGNDRSNRYWAYAELYAVTGEMPYHDKITKLLKDDFPLTALGYGELGGLGSLAYLLCDRMKDQDTVIKLRKAFSDRAEQLKKLSDSCGYGAAMGERDYHWGSNMSVMKNGMVFALNSIINSDPDGRKYAARQLHYLLGTNALGISYVTGNGAFRTNYPHLRPAFADGIDECIPGMVAGGPNSLPADPFAVETIPEGTPPMKCYADDTASYSLNEITIYWNSPAVFVLAYLCDK